MKATLVLAGRLCFLAIAAVMGGLRMPLWSAVPVGWVQVASDTEFQPRDSAGELVYHDRLWLLGGWFNSYETPPRDVWKSADGRNWEFVTNRPPWKHSDFAMTVVFKDRMWLMGGWYNGRLENASASDQVWSSQDGKHWDLAAEHAGWSPRMAAGIATFDGRLWILGGVEKYYFGDDRSYRNDVWNSSDGKTWHQVTAAAPWTPRAYHQVLSFNGRLWVIGGGKYMPRYEDSNEVWSSPDGVNWTQVVAKAAWEPRLWFSSVVYRNRMWVLGGWSQNPANPTSDGANVWGQPDGKTTMANWNDVWHSADGQTWERLKTTTVWKARHEHSAYVFDDKLWVVAGHTRPLTNDVWSLQLPRDWPAVRTGGSPGDKPNRPEDN